MTAAETALPSPFAQAAPSLSAMGWSCLPLVPSSVMRHRSRGKCPGVYRAGHWQGLDNWEKRKETPLHGFELSMAMNAPEANIGLILGTVARPGLYTIAVDVDAEDPDTVDAIVRCLPASPMQKRGAKGRTLFFAAPKSITSRSFDDHRIPRGAGVPRRLVDLLTGFQTKQTVCPPSVHPEGPVYVWLAGPVSASELPVFDEDALTVLEETLQQFGYDPEAARGGRGERKPYVPSEAGDLGGDPFETAKRAALANIGAWIGDVENLGGLRPARAGFEAVNLRRSSSSGRPDAERRRNLSVQPTGICDFGTGETWSAIDLVAEFNGLTVSEALTFLEGRLGLNEDDGFSVDLSGMLSSQEEPPVAVAGPADFTGPAMTIGLSEGHSKVGDSHLSDHDLPERREQPSGIAGSSEFPAHLLDCPGLVGDIADWMGRTAQRPLPTANLLTALSVVATAAARRFATPSESSLVIYGLALAPSGSGKAHPIRAGQHILRKAGLGHMIAPSSFMSGSAMVQAVSRQPACVTFSDEVAEFFAKMNAGGASSHERAISTVLRELFGTNWGSYVTPGWAQSNTAANIPPAIHAPGYSFIGYSVPEAVWSAMQGADITNGMLNRFILMPTLSAGIEQDDPESVFDMPEALSDRLRAIAETGGPLVSATMHTDQATEPLVRVQWDGGKTGRARKLFQELRTHCNEHPSGEHLMKRTAEIAVRLATVRAIGRDGQRAVVTPEDMYWGRNVALFSAERMIHDAAAYMSETEWQQKALSVLRIIIEAPGRSITKTGLYRRLNHKYKSVEVKAILDGLKDTGQVVENSARTGERGPASIIYKAV